MGQPNDPPPVDVGASGRDPTDDVAPDLVAWMAHQRPGPDDATALLGLAPGDRVLDLGCGPGVDLAAQASASSPDTPDQGRSSAVDPPAAP